MKKILYFVLSFSLMISFLNLSVFANTQFNETIDSFGCTFTSKAFAVNEFINDEGNRVVVFENGVEVEYFEDDSMIIRDYNNAFNADLTKKQPRGWISIGIAIVKVIGGIVGTCLPIIQYVFGHDICRIALEYMGFGQNDGNYEYLVSGNYVSGYIPGCEPSHSLPCNSGYYEYRVEKV